MMRDGTRQEARERSVNTVPREHRGTGLDWKDKNKRYSCIMFEQVVSEK